MELIRQAVSLPALEPTEAADALDGANLSALSGIDVEPASVYRTTAQAEMRIAAYAARPKRG